MTIANQTIVTTLDLYALAIDNEADKGWRVVQVIPKKFVSGAAGGLELHEVMILFEREDRPPV